MHPASTLADASPKTDEPSKASGQHQRHTSPGFAVHPSSRHTHSPHSASPMRKNTTSSTSTNATHTTGTTITSNESPGTPFSLDASPSFSSQQVFSVKDGADLTGGRRASRRRTGPLSAEQREKAALIRKLGACNDCRRRRVACHPNHHNMTWEDAFRKYRAHSPVHELAPLGARPLSPRPVNLEPLSNGNTPLLTHDPHDMEVDSAQPPPTTTPTPLPPNQQQLPPPPPIRAPLGSESRVRKPLPSGPRLEKLAGQASQAVHAARAAHSSPQQTAESIQSELQAAASKIASNPYRSRYTAVQALLLYWEDDEDDGELVSSVEYLAEVLQKDYQYVTETKTIPSSPESGKSPWRWLSRTVTNFVDNRDDRDVLKLVFYKGQSYLDGDREMVLARSRDRLKGPTIRWSGIQQILEETSSDTLIIMDAAYYPSSKLVRQQGVLEVVAASASEEHFGSMGNASFTRAVAEQLHTRISQRNHMAPLTAAELHAKLLSSYPKMVQDRYPEKPIVKSFPSPLHMQISGNSRLPSILLAPLRRGLLFGIEPDPTAPRLNLTLQFGADSAPFDMEKWAEWLRLMPDGVKDVKVEWPCNNFNNTFP
ncbi:hypothetical protein RB594_000945 [Gaeumannomyces avenae]